MEHVTCETNSPFGTEADAGIEPPDDSDANDNVPCACENCQQCRAAYALHLECFKGHYLASIDADLQAIIGGWEKLPDATRYAFLALARLPE